MTMLSRLRGLLPLAALMLAPSGLRAQGRIIGRPCSPPCLPRADCPRPMLPPCGGSLLRLSTATTVTLDGRVLRYEVTEVFRNAGGTVAEADYVFPLPAGAAFEDLKLSINGELVSGETMSAEKARVIYEEIVRRQRDPALVEWMGSGMLRTRIFPIAPGEEKRVVVRFQSVATREGDALRIDYRRGTEPAGGRVGMVAIRTVARSTREETDETWSRFTLRYRHGDSYGEPYSPTHALRTIDDGPVRRVEARGTASEVTVLLPLRRADVASMSVLTHATRGEPGFALITLTPPALAPVVTPRDLTFVIDVSGSMQGRKLAQAKAAGETLLASLRPADRFRIVDFSTDVRTFRDDWTSATGENIRAARRHLDGLRAEGSTNISEALRVALDTRRPGGRLPLVVFVTDGEPTVGERNPDLIAAIASSLRGETRVFSIGVSSGVNATLVEQLALQGRGTAHFIRDEESVESAVSLLARRLAEPVLTDVRLVAHGVRLSRVLPAGPIDIFAGQDLVILARYDGSGDAAVRLEGRGPNGPVTWTTRAGFSAETRANPFVARLWAAQRIGWLAAEKRRGGTRELDDEIRALGERYGIPTEFSSYLVLEPGMNASAVSAAAGGVGSLRRGDGVQAGSTRQVAPAAASAPGRAEAQFEAARAAADQRTVTTTASLDEVRARDARAPGTGERTVENRRFRLANGVWSDGAFASGTRTVRVQPYSPLYFELMRRLAALHPVFALGDRVIVAGRRVALELHPEGLQQLDEALLAGVLRDW